MTITRLRSTLEASRDEVERLKADLSLCKVARQMLADDMKRLGEDALRYGAEYFDMTHVLNKLATALGVGDQKEKTNG